MVITSAALKCCKLATAPASSWAGPIGIWVVNFPNRYKTMAPKRCDRRHRWYPDHAGRDDRNNLAHPWPYAGHDVLHFHRVRPGGKPVNVAYSGGTAFNFVNNTPDPGIKNFQNYIDSQKHMAAKAAETKATGAAFEPLRV